MDLNRFQFDYDLTWAALFLNAHGHTYARYGTRKDRDAAGMMSAAGLRRVMEKVLEVHRKDAGRKTPQAPPKLAESFATLPPDIRSGKKCMHCHQVWEHLRREDPSFGKKETQELYPLPENLGMTLDVDRGSVVASTDPSGFAARAGIRQGDEILAMNGTPVYSAADVSWVLHTLGKGASVRTELARGGATRTVTVAPSGDWRVRDISWRGSMWGLRPATGFGGKRLDDGELRKLGLPPGTFAFRVNYIVDWGGTDNPAGANAKKAGLRKGDIVVSVAGKNDFKSELEFQCWFRLTRTPGTEIELGVFRNGRVEKLRLRVSG